MAAVSFVMFLPFLALGGSASGDVLSFVDPEAYFRSRQVPITVNKMLELAGKEPTDAKSEVMQLLAIRMLGDDPNEVKNEKAAILKVLEPLATGKPGERNFGLPGMYARHTLARLGEKVANHRESRDRLIQGFGWFPEKSTFVAGSSATAAVGDKSPMAEFIKTNAGNDMEEMYKFIEAVGDVRMDRFAMAYLSDPQQPNKGHIYMRLSGAGHHQRLAEFLKKSGGLQGEIKEQKGPKGEPITIFSGGNFGPAFALIGDTDLLIGGYEHLGQPSNHAEVVEQMLKVRAGEKPSVLKGPLGEEIKKASTGAGAIMLGEVPADMRRGLLGGGPFQSMPERLKVIVKSGARDHLDIDFHGKFSGVNEAKLFAEAVVTLRKQGLEALKTPPPTPPGMKVPPRIFEQMRQTLEDLKVQAKGDAVTAETRVNLELVSFTPMMMFGVRMHASPPMPPMPQAVPKAPAAK